MKRNLLFIFFVLAFSENLFAQNPLVKQWDKRYGGTYYEYLYSFLQTNDGGYILGGVSNSGINGDKSEFNWDTTFQTVDYWIVKTDSIGNKQWDKRYGGLNTDWLFSMQKTTDGGYILGGTSNSDSSGNKTQSSQGDYDYWVVKIDSLGSIQWDKRYGGSLVDELYSLQQTSDGGYILGGASFSDISGDKTKHNWDSTFHTPDYWVVKIDSLGNKQWDNRYGGKGWDWLTSLQSTNDGRYILGGFSYSGHNGNKSQSSQGACDYWIVKINSNGTKQWDKRFGGNKGDVLYSLQQTSDGGYILGGISSSDYGGDVTVFLSGYFDFWLVKADSLGNKQWDINFGGAYQEQNFGNVLQTTDEGFLLTGSSTSPASGSKTENNLGLQQTWVVKTNSLGIKQWDKTIFTPSTGYVEIGYSIQTNERCYSIANYTDAGIGGYKTQPSWGGFDYWTIKFCDTTLTSGLVNNSNFVFQISVYPNPFSSDLSIMIQKLNIKQAVFIIKNVFGQVVFAKQENNLNNTYTKTIDLSFLSKGIYLLDVMIDGERTVKKIVKE